MGKDSYILSQISVPIPRAWEYINTENNKEVV